MQTSVSNTTPKAILDACSRAGADVSALMKTTGLDRGKIYDLNGRTSFDDVIELWDASYKMTKDRAIGIKAVDFLPFGAFRVIDFMVLTGATPTEGLAKAQEYYPLINQGFDLVIEPRNDKLVVELHNPVDPKHMPFHYVDFVFACVLSRIRFSAGSGLNPECVQLMCDRPDDETPYELLFRSPILYNQSVNRIKIEKYPLEARQPNADEYLFEMLDVHAQSLIRQIPGERDVLHELTRIIRSNLANGDIDLDSSARELGLSRRSLQRKLYKNGVTYRELINKIRFDLAKDLLSGNTSSIEETAFLVGYSDKTSFYRAFKRWTGKTPNDYSSK